MPVPQTFQSGQAAITRIICQQCQQKKAKGNDNTPGGGTALVVGPCKAGFGLQKFEPFHCWLLSWRRMQRFFLTNIFSEKDKGSGWKDESLDVQVRRQWKRHLHTAWFFCKIFFLWEWGNQINYEQNRCMIVIPYICHFFTRAKFLENKIYAKKRQFFALNL